jgi:CRISPR-associated protein Cas4
MELVVEGKGSFIGKHQGRLRVTCQQKTVTEVPLIHLKQVIIVSGGVGISSDVIRTCSEEGIPIHFVSGRGTAFASLYSAGLTGTVITRRAQLLAYEHNVGVTVVRAFVTGKLENQANLLRYMAKYRKETNTALYEELMLVALGMRDFIHDLEQLKAEKIDDIREQILSIEGRAAQRYWAMIARIIPDELEWPGRETQGATDLFNGLMEEGIRQHTEEEDREERRSLRHYQIKEGERFFHLALQSETLGLVARIDLAIATPSRTAVGAEGIVVEYKYSEQKAGAHFKLQLAAYALLLEEAWNIPLKRGFVYSIPLRSAEVVPITPALRKKVLQTVASIRQLVERQEMPEPPTAQGRCVTCEFRRFCNDVV